MPRLRGSLTSDWRLTFMTASPTALPRGLLTTPSPASLRLTKARLLEEQK